MIKQPNFFQSYPSTLPKGAPAKFYLSTTFGLGLMISFVAPTRLSNFYAYLTTKIGNCNLKCCKVDYKVRTDLTADAYRRLFQQKNCFGGKNVAF